MTEPQPGAAARTVEAEINYLGPMADMPYFYAQRHDLDHLVLEGHRVVIADARGYRQRLRLETDGFLLADHPSAVTDWLDDTQLATLYPPEIEALIRQLTGADHVVVNGGAVRRFGERDPRPEYVNSHPARFVHVDYSRASFDQFARSHLEGHPERAALLAGHYAAYNIWRAVTPPPQDVPLAICAAASLDPADRVTGEARVDYGDGRPDFVFGSTLVRANPRHRWHYFPAMTAREALVFKAFDSDEAALQGCPHVAFDDPGCPPGGIPRGSIEIRAFAYWKAPA
jgi:hypothetical protein